VDAILSCHGHREIDGTMMRLYQLAAPLLIIRPVLNCQCSGMVGGVMRIGSFDGVTWRTALEKPILSVRECDRCKYLPRQLQLSGFGSGFGSGGVHLARVISESQVWMWIHLACKAHGERHLYTALTKQIKQIARQI